MWSAVMESSASELSSAPDDEVVVASIMDQAGPRSDAALTTTDTNIESDNRTSQPNDATATSAVEHVQPETPVTTAGATAVVEAQPFSLISPGQGSSVELHKAEASIPNGTTTTVPLSEDAHPVDNISVGGATTSASATKARPKPTSRARGGKARTSAGARTANGRNNKRKRGSTGGEGGDSDEHSDSSEVCTPIATQTKSGRAITKPTTFVPPPSLTLTQTAAEASPQGPVKRKKVSRKNPEAAVCKMCLRGTSPSNNMIVFCDGCNAAYHRYCHHPPIDQSVVDELDKEWYCLACEQERAQSHALSAPVDVLDRVAIATPIAEAERRRYFNTLSYGTLVSLLTTLTAIHPQLPVYEPKFKATRKIDDAISAGLQVKPPLIMKDAIALTNSEDLISASNAYTSALLTPVPDEHPAHYPRPGCGFMASLPPDREDAEYLVDEEDKYGVFSHVYQTDERVANGAVASPATGRAAAKKGKNARPG